MYTLAGASFSRGGRVWEEKLGWWEEERVAEHSLLVEAYSLAGKGMGRMGQWKAIKVLCTLRGTLEPPRAPLGPKPCCLC